MILLDWTRMGRTYCLAGAVAAEGGFRIVRPLLTKGRTVPQRKAGWSSFLLDGHTRWEVFELVGAEPAAPEPPHVEDLWVRALRPRRCLAPVAQRQEILVRTASPSADALFGVPLRTNRTAAFIEPGTGTRSLATLVVPSKDLRFTASWRAGCDEPDVRVSLPVPPLGGRTLAVKDHHLLCRAERAGRDIGRQLGALADAVRQMGDVVAVRLGLSRGFQGLPGSAAAVCWLMADGFFALCDPQP